MEIYNKVILKALFEIRRHQVLTAKLNPATAQMYGNAYTYAILHRVCPAYDEQPESLAESFPLPYDFPFEDAYQVRREQVVEIAELLDGKWLAKEMVTFYDLETLYTRGQAQWTGKDLRTELANLCRYLYLRGMFDAEFWKQFMSHAPSEALDITHGWNSGEINDWT